MPLKRYTVLMFPLLLPLLLFAQQQPQADKFVAPPEKFFNGISKRIAHLDHQLTRQSQKYLERLYHREKRLKQKLAKTDSAAAEKLFAGTEEKYQQLSDQLQQETRAGGKTAGQYQPYWDSLKTSLAFLEQQSNLFNGQEAIKDKIQHSVAQVNALQSRLQQSDQIKAFIKQRRQQIKEALSRYTNLPNGLAKQFGEFQKDVYYYNRQVQEYKELLNHPDQLTKKVIALLSKTKAFQQFMQQHSQLAGLFRLPANYGTPQSLAGLQTRSQVQQLLQAQLGTAGPNLPARQANPQQLLQQSLQNAQSQLNSLKDKLNELGGGSGELPDLPEGFKPNNEKTRSFWQRLELGTNLQSTRANNYFVTTTDLGLSVGYRLSEKNIVGIGFCYKAGWGKDIRHIVLTSEGVGFRSFLDVNLKKSLFATAGFEYNYQQPFSELRQLGDYDVWQRSWLIGVSKLVSLKTKFFKKTKLQLLWDLLSFQQVPRGQAVKFRIGYNF